MIQFKPLIFWSLESAGAMPQLGPEVGQCCFIGPSLSGTPYLLHPQLPYNFLGKLW